MVLGPGFCRGSPSGWFPLAVFLRVSCLRSGGGGFGWLSLAGPYVPSGTFTWCLFASILFPSCATRGRFAVPGVLVSGSGLSASACSHACGRFRGIAPRSWCWLSIRLSSWWKGRLMGQRLVIVPLPWTAVFIHSVFSRDLSLQRYLSWGRGLFFLLCLSVYCRTWWHLSIEETGRSSRRFYVFQSLYLVGFCLT